MLNEKWAFRPTLPGVPLLDFHLILNYHNIGCGPLTH